MENQYRKYREKAQLTQKQLAETLGIVQTTVSMWESGKAKPRLGTLIKLSRVFGCSIEELVDFKATTTETQK